MTTITDRRPLQITAAALTAIERALERGYIIYIQATCASRGACGAYETTIRVKDHYSQVFSTLHRRRTLFCPMCGNTMQVFTVRSQDEQQLQREAESRRDVNLQMYKRDYLRDTPGAFGVPIPLGILHDELPPTPPNWFDRTRSWDHEHFGWQDWSAQIID